MTNKTQNPRIRLTIKITAAIVKAFSDQSPSRQSSSNDALNDLRSALGEAQRLEFLGLQFEALLAIGEIERDLKRIEAIALLDNLEKQAKARISSGSPVMCVSSDKVIGQQATEPKQYRGFGARTVHVQTTHHIRGITG